MFWLMHHYIIHHRIDPLTYPPPPTTSHHLSPTPRESPSPPIPRPPPVFVASGLKKTEQEAAQRLAAAHGGRFLRQWQPDVTHVIVRTGPRLEAGRTLKFLQGVAARKWLVAPAWVQDSLSARRLLPEVSGGGGGSGGGEGDIGGSGVRKKFVIFF